MNIIEEYKKNKEEYFYYGEWPQPPFAAYFWVYWYDQKLAQKMEIGPLKKEEIFANGHFIPLKSNLEKIKKPLRAAIENKDPDFVKNLLRVSEEIFKKSLESAEEFKNAEVSPESFRRFIEISRPIMVPWYANVVLSDELAEHLVATTEKHGLNVTEILDKIPQRETYVSKQHKEALRIKKMLEEKDLLGKPQEMIEKDEEVWQAIEEHIKEFTWVGTHNWIGKGYSSEKLLKELPKLSKTAKPKEIPEDLPEDLKFIMEISKEISYIRQVAAEISSIIYIRTRPYLDRMAKKLDLSYRELLLVTPLEILQALEDKTKDIKELALKRKKGYAYLLKDGKETILDNINEIKEFLEIFLQKADKSVTEFTGTVACKGHVEGRAKVILTPKDFPKMKEKDILVTTMTTPDFVPLMKISSAVVTDIGGLLSHAAIVSRELNIPCVIGTKIATKVLKDGNRVEVDADRGIVKILKK